MTTTTWYLKQQQQNKNVALYHFFLIDGKIFY